VLRDLTGLPDEKIAACCRLRGWRPGHGMPMSNVLVAAAHLGARFDYVDVPRDEPSLAGLMMRKAWRVRLSRGAWLLCVERHVFGLFDGDLRGVVRAGDVVSPVTSLYRQGR
jgi:hypothetical protein